MSVTIDASSVTKWLNNTSNRSNSLRVATELIANKSADNLRQRSRSISTTGELLRGISGKTEYNNNGSRAMVESSSKYAQAALETGRRPGKQPPIDALRVWSAKKLGDPDLAYLVARKIAREGTNKYQSKKPAYITDTTNWIENNLLTTVLPKLLDEYVK